MGYGKASMSETQKNKTRTIFDTAAQGIQQTNEVMPEGMITVNNAALELNKQTILQRITYDQSSAHFDDYVSNYDVVRETSWLKQVNIPEQTEIDSEIQNARQTIGSLKEGGMYREVAALSQSQRTKRGKKFKDKAERQAKAIKERNLYEKGRDIALMSVVNGSLPQNAPIQDEDQIDQYINDQEHLSESTRDNKKMLNDIAFYALWRDYSESDNGKQTASADFFKKLPKRKLQRGQVEKTHQAKMMDLMNRDAYREECVNMLLEMDALDLDVFNYSSDEEFVRNYSCRITVLKAFSHSDMLRKLVRNDNRIAPIYEKLIIKGRIIEDIIADYEMRIKLIRSPYYALMASKDVDSMSEDDLNFRIDNAVDQGDMVVAEYLQAMLDKRERDENVKEPLGTFVKGSKASSILKKRLALYSKPTPEAKERMKAEKRQEKIRKAEERREKEAEKIRQRMKDDPVFRAKIQKLEEDEQLKEEREILKQIEKQEKELEKKRLKQEKAEAEAQKKIDAENKAKQQKDAHYVAKFYMDSYIENLGDFYPQIKKADKKIKDSDAIAMALEMRADKHTANYERYKTLIKTYPQRQQEIIEPNTIDYTDYLVGFTSTEKEAIKWLNSKLSFSGSGDNKTLNAKVPSLNAILDTYQEKLILLIRDHERIEEATNSVKNGNIDRLFMDYGDNKNFTKAERNLLKSIQEGIATYRESNINSAEHKALCDDIKKTAITICKELMRAYTEDLGMDESYAEEHLGKAMLIGNMKERKKYDESIASISGTIDAKRMPKQFPEAYAENAYKVFFGKKPDKMAAEGYDERRKKAKDYKGVMDAYYKKQEQETAEFLDIKDVGVLRDETKCLSFLDEKDRREFFKAAVATNKKQYYKMDKDAVLIVRNGIRKVFDHLLELDFDTLNFNSDDELFEKFSELKKYAELGFVLMSLIEKYNDVGGILTAEEHNRLSVISHTLCGLKDCIEARCMLAVNPDWILLGRERVEKIKDDKLKAISEEQEAIRSANVSKASRLESEMISLKESKKEYIRSKADAEFYISNGNYKIYAAANNLKFSDAKKKFEDRISTAAAKITEIDVKIKKNSIALEKLRKETADAERYKSLADKYLSVKKMEGKTEKGKIYNIAPGVSFTKALKENDKGYEKSLSDSNWESIKNGYFSDTENLNNNLWKTDSADPYTVEKLYYLGKNSLIFGEMAANKKKVELKKLKKTPESLSYAFWGLILQFKELTRTSTGNGEKQEVKYAFKQFRSLTMSRNGKGSENLGKTIAQYKHILTLAQGLDKVFSEDEQLKKDVLSLQLAEDLALYNEIIEFSKMFLPMVGDMEYMMKDSYIKDKEKARIKSAIEFYLQTFLVDERTKEYSGTTKWTMPSIAGGYKEFYDAIGNDEAMTTLIDKYYKARDGK